MTNEEFMDALVRLLKFQGFHDAATLFEAVRFFSFHLLESIYILLQITVTPRNQMICLLNNFVYCSMFLIFFAGNWTPIFFRSGFYWWPTPLSRLLTKLVAWPKSIKTLHNDFVILKLSFNFFSIRFRISLKVLQYWFFTRWPNASWTKFKWHKCDRDRLYGELKHG